MPGNRRSGCVIQARCGSSRFPGKVLRPIAGREMLLRVTDRVRQCPEIETLVVATTTLPEDDAVAKLVSSVPGVQVFRGNEEDVLDRYFQAASQLALDPVVRVTGDNPLTDPQILSELVEALRADASLDYVRSEGYPLGVGAEAFRFRALQRAHREAAIPYQREHVTPYFREHAESFKIVLLAAPERLRRPDLRLTVDTEEDLELMEAIYRRLEPRDGRINTAAVIDLLAEEPELSALNAHVQQRSVGNLPV